MVVETLLLGVFQWHHMRMFLLHYGGSMVVTIQRIFRTRARVSTTRRHRLEDSAPSEVLLELLATQRLVVSL